MNLIRLGKSFLIGLGFGFVAYIITGSEASGALAMFLWYYEYHKGLWLLLIFQMKIRLLLESHIVSNEVVEFVPMQNLKEE